MGNRTAYGVHDLLKVQLDGAISLRGFPPWAEQILKQTPWVVVRREVSSSLDAVPVGIRGRKRGERFATWLPLSSIVECLTPEMLTARITEGLRGHPMPMMAILPEIGKALVDETWGPAGSVAFELATARSDVTLASDLDIVLRWNRAPVEEKIRALLQRLAEVTERADVLVETPGGAFALSEYLTGKQPIALRTAHGPRMVQNPWAGSRDLNAAAAGCA